MKNYSILFLASAFILGGARTLPQAGGATGGADLCTATAIVASQQFAIETSRLALSKAFRPFVRDLGKVLLQQDTGSLRQLEELARQNGLSLAAELSETQQEEYQKLESLEGYAFDREYTRAIFSAKKELLRQVNDEKKYGAITALKDWAGSQYFKMRNQAQVTKVCNRMVKKQMRSAASLRKLSRTM